jgi:hypothetical protein
LPLFALAISLVSVVLVSRFSAATSGFSSLSTLTASPPGASFIRFGVSLGATVASFRKIESSSQADSETRFTDGNFPSASDWAAAGVVDVLVDSETGVLRSGIAAGSETLAEPVDSKAGDLRSGVAEGSEILAEPFEPTPFTGAGGWPAVSSYWGAGLLVLGAGLL